MSSGTSVNRKPQRIELIKQIQNERNSSLITYLTSTRPGLEVPMNIDIIRYIYDHLEKIKNGHKGKTKPKIDLLIHSNGGDGIVPWRLVTLIREYTDDFGVLVPHRAFSAATLTALGANEIIMHPMGMLGPTDPSVSNQFNPVNNKSGLHIPISVEDVIAYIQLIKEDVGINHEDELVQAFNILANQIHPLALGNVRRSISQSRMMASKLLNLHISPKEQHKITEIADNLTSKLFYHGHPINRKEAREQIGLDTVRDAPLELEALMWKLYLEYEDELKLLAPFKPAEQYQTEITKIRAEKKGNNISKTNPTTAKIAFIESTFDTDVATLSYELVGNTEQNGKTNVIMTTLEQGWRKETME